jgi:nucleoside 2-deoxyribosyltransferase
MSRCIDNLVLGSKSLRRTIYLASPYGFSAQWKRLLLPEFMTALEAMGLEVWEPFARNDQIDVAKPGWAYRVAQKDLQDVRDADALFAIVNGTPPDEGVMVELGAAIALGKPIFLFRDDFRRCTDSEEFPLNLMLFAGLPERGWQDFVYENIAEIGRQDKAIARWLLTAG